MDKDGIEGVDLGCGVRRVEKPQPLHGSRPLLVTSSNRELIKIVQLFRIPNPFCCNVKLYMVCVPM